MASVRPLRAQIKGQRYALNKNKYLLDPEVDQLERIFATSIDNSPRDTLLLWLGLRTGARAQELLDLRAADLNSYDQTVFYPWTKGQ